MKPIGEGAREAMRREEGKDASLIVRWENTLTSDKLVDFLQELLSLNRWHADFGEVVVLHEFEVGDLVGAEGNKGNREVWMDMLRDPREKIEFCLRRILQEGSLRFQDHRQRISRRYHSRRLAYRE